MSNRYFFGRRSRWHVSLSETFRTGVLLVLCALAAFTASAQTVTIPSANTNSGSVNDPFGSWYGYERSAMIYTPAEIGSAGSISTVAFFLNASTSPGNSTDVRIYMKERTTLLTANTTYASETSGATLVYGPATLTSSSFTGGAIGNWYTVTLDEAFNYTHGSNNLEIIIETNATGGGSGEGSTGKQFRYSSPGSNQYYQNWNQDTTAPTGNGTRSANRPNVQLTLSPIVECTEITAGGTTGTTASLPVCPGLSFTLNVSGATSDNNGGVTYQWYSSPDGVAAYEAISGAESASYTTSLTSGAFFRRETICEAGSSSMFSDPLEITVTIIDTYPFTETFETSSTSRACWNPSSFVSGTLSWVFNTGNTGGAVVGAHGGTTVARFYVGNYAPVNTTRLVTPIFDLTSLTTPQVNFWYATPGWDGDQDELRVYYRTSTAGSWTLISGAEYTTDTPAWTEITLTLPSPSAEYQLAFEGTEYYGRGIMVDDVTVRETPSCPNPSLGAASNLTPDSADLNWQENGTATEWQIEYDEAGFTLGTGIFIDDITVLPYELSGLTENTNYEFYYRSDCGGDQSDWIGPVSFYTLCETINTFPFNEGFESASTTVSCWSNAFSLGSTPWTLGAGSTNVFAPITTAQEGSVNARFYFEDVGATTLLISPTFDLTSLTTPELNFWFATPSWAGDIDDLYVYYRTSNTGDWTPIPGAEWIETNISSWTEATFTLPDPSDEYTLAFVADGYYGYGVLLDNVTVREAPSCPAPSLGAASGVTGNSADLNWQENGTATDWEIEYGEVGFELGVDGILIQDIFSLPYEVSGLSAGTAYEVYYRSDCGGDLSEWAGPITFTTGPGCGSTFLDPGGAGNYANGTNYTVTICPDNPGDVVTVSFSSFSTEAGWDGLLIYDGPTTSEALIPSGLPAGSGANAPANSFYGTTSPGTVTSTHASGCLTFWFRSDGTGTDSGWESTVSCGAPPTCGAPSVSGLTPSYNSVSFTINASGVGTPAGYEYEIVADGDPATGTGTPSLTNAVTAGGLDPVTAYDLYVRTDCGIIDGFSEWIGPISFTTNQAPPANDDCAGAITINCASTPVSGTTLNATVDASYIPFTFNMGSNTTERGVWYHVAGDDQYYEMTTCATFGYDTRITVYQGSCGSLTPITANDDMEPACPTGNFRSLVGFNAFTGNDYYVFIHGYQSGVNLSATGNFELNITCSEACVAEANDACASAEVLTPEITCEPVTGNTTCATPTAGLPNPVFIDGGFGNDFVTLNDVWYQFTAAASDGYIRFDNVEAVGLYYAIYFIDPCSGDDSGESGVQDLVQEGEDIGFFGAEVGETYWMRVFVDPTVSGAADGAFDLCVRSLPCSTPIAATATATSQTNVNVVIDGVEGDSYIIEYGPIGFTPGEDGDAGTNGTIVTTNTLDTDIPVSANQNYQFYVRKDCSGSSEGYSFNIFAGQVSTFIVVPASGNNTISGCGVTIFDHAGNADYGNNAEGYLVLTTSSPAELLQITGSYSGIESGWDYLRIYAGAGTGGTLLGTFTGSGAVDVSAPTPGTPLTVRFTSDVSNSGAGFELTSNCLLACANPITPGAVSSSVATACSGQNFTVSLNTPALGYTYQWQRRTATTNWTNIGGATNSSLTTSQTVATDYRCRVGCTYAGGSSTYPSGFVSVGMNSYANCYCAPVYEYGTGDDDWITNVSLGSINNSTGASSAPYHMVYAPAANTTTTIQQGGSYEGSVTVTTAWGDLDVAVWIDFNRNGTFETSERVAQTSGGELQDGDSAPVSFVVPPTASLGTARMRVRTEFLENDIAPCGEVSGFGETEDYTVTIVAGSANDARVNATNVNPAVYPACSNISGNLVNATPSASGEGNDLWYRFVAASNAVRIQLTGSGDNLIELEDQAGNPIELADDGAGSEILANGSLTPGDTYYVAIRNVTSPASYTVCIQTLAASSCDSGPVYTSLCNTFKADWTGTNNYVATFTETTAPFASYVANINGSTSIPLRNIPGLQHGRSYDVSVDAVYTIGSETITATSTSDCPATITQHPYVNLRAADSEPATRTIGAFIGTDVLVCGNTDWEWTFELVDENGDPIGIEGPVSVLTGSTSRYIRTSQIPGVAGGNRYRVRVRPIFGSESGVFDDASFHYLQISGSAGMVESFDGTASPAEIYFERNTENGVFAALYPNPNNGEMVNLNIAGLDSESVQVRIFDATGRVVYSHRYVVEGALNTIVSFQQPLTSGLYVVEMTYNNEVITERMMVTK